MHWTDGGLSPGHMAVMLIAKFAQWMVVKNVPKRRRMRGRHIKANIPAAFLPMKTLSE